MKVFIKKLGQEVELDFDSLPKASQDYILAYGMKQSLNDSIADAKNQDEALGMLEARLGKLKAGTMGQRAAGAGLGELERTARALIKKHLKFKGFGGEFLDQKVDELWNSPKVLAKAEALLEEKRQAAQREAALFGGLDLGI